MASDPAERRELEPHETEDLQKRAEQGSSLQKKKKKKTVGCSKVTPLSGDDLATADQATPDRLVSSFPGEAATN